MATKDQFVKALEELRKISVPRNFEQSVDLIINLNKIDVKKTPINAVAIIPHAPKENKICAFLEQPNENFDRVITKSEVPRWQKKEIKGLIKEYDFFISAASLMPAVATTFGRTLGPSGKMPNPKTGGVLMREDENEIKTLVNKLKKSVTIRPKEKSVKLLIGKEKMKNEDIAENAVVIYDTILNLMPNKKENIKNVMVKFTMSKAVKIK